MSGKNKKKPSQRPVMLKVLKAENAVLDSILVRQSNIHENVKEKNWELLYDSLCKMDRLSLRFTQLEDRRLNLEREVILAMRPAPEPVAEEDVQSEEVVESADSDNTNNDDIKQSSEEKKESDEKLEPLRLTFEERAFLYGDKRVSDVLSKVRTKLARSKIENKALNVYVGAANGFVQGIMDKIVPQRKNTVYNRYGKMSKPAVHSLVIDKVF